MSRTHIHTKHGWVEGRAQYAIARYTQGQVLWFTCIRDETKPESDQCWSVLYECLHPDRLPLTVSLAGDAWCASNFYDAFTITPNHRYETRTEIARALWTELTSRHGWRRHDDPDPTYWRGRKNGKSHLTAPTGEPV